MSANRDPSQKHTFVYTNLYQIYRKGKQAAQSAQPHQSTPPAKDSTRTGIVTGRIIKAEEMRSISEGAGPVGVKVLRHEPPRFIGKRIEANRPTLTPKQALERRQAIDGLKDNLRQLQGLHERLRFMLKEIEELSKK